jgi:hypothetical protein
VGTKAPKEYVGSALTIMNCIGFSITIVSIQATIYLKSFIKPEFLLFFLVIGPLLGLRWLWPLVRSSGVNHGKNQPQTEV